MAQKANCSFLIFGPTALIILPRISLSITLTKNFEVEERRLIGRKLVERLWILFGFGIVMIMACFKVLGKQPIRRQPLMILVRNITALLGRRFRGMFRILYAPEDFRLSRCFIIFCIMPGIVKSPWQLGEFLMKFTLVFTSGRFRPLLGENWFRKCLPAVQLSLLQSRLVRLAP